MIPDGFTDLVPAEQLMAIRANLDGFAMELLIAGVKAHIVSQAIQAVARDLETIERKARPAQALAELLKARVR